MRLLAAHGKHPDDGDIIPQMRAESKSHVSLTPWGRFSHVWLLCCRQGEVKREA
jgi:hypothetical protein